MCDLPTTSSDESSLKHPHMASYQQLQYYYYWKFELQNEYTVCIDTFVLLSGKSIYLISSGGHINSGHNTAIGQFKSCNDNQLTISTLNRISLFVTLEHTITGHYLHQAWSIIISTLTHTFFVG